MPRAKVRGAPRTVEFSLYCEFGICVLRLGFRFLVRRYDRNFSPQFCESLTRKHEMLHIWITLECLWYPKTPLWELWDPNPAPRPPRGMWPIRQVAQVSSIVIKLKAPPLPQCAQRPRGPLSISIYTCVRGPGALAGVGAQAGPSSKPLFTILSPLWRVGHLPRGGHGAGLGSQSSQRDVLGCQNHPKVVQI